MLRLLVLALLLANVGFYAWTQGLLARYGFAPAVHAEPERLARQLRPQAMRLIGAAETRQPEGATSMASATSAECLQAGLFTDEQARLLRTRLQASLPPDSWSLGSSVEPARWIVYMGKFTNEEILATKRSELRRLGVAFELLGSAALGPGLSLGQFGSRPDAESALARITRQGVRSARVVLERPEVRGELLTLPAVDAPLRKQLEALKPQLAGKSLQACR